MNSTELEECEVTGKMSIENVQKLLTDTTKRVGIYGLRNKETGKWYVGLSSNISQRWKKYKRLNCKSQKKLYASLAKNGFDGFDKYILEECKEENLGEREIFWINKLDSISDGYNVMKGGQAPTEEIRNKISASLIGKTHSDETKEKMSLALIGNDRAKGLTHSEEHNQKIGLSKVGKKRKPFSDEWKKKISLGGKGKPKTEEWKQKMRLSWARRKGLIF